MCRIHVSHPFIIDAELSREGCGFTSDEDSLPIDFNFNFGLQWQTRDETNQVATWCGCFLRTSAQLVPLPS